MSNLPHLFQLNEATPRGQLEQAEHAIALAEVSHVDSEAADTARMMEAAARTFAASKEEQFVGEFEIKALACGG